MRVTAALFIALALISTDSAFAQRRVTNYQQQPDPNHEEAKKSADEAYRKGDYRRTEQLTTTVLDENPRDHVALYLRGSARVELGLRRRDGKLIRQGIADAREAVRIERSEPMYYLPYLYGMTSLATIEDRPEHAEVAVKVGDQALGLRGVANKDRANLFYQRGNAHKLLKNYDAAVEDFKEATQLDPAHLGAVVALPDAYGLAGKPDEALAAFSSAVRAFPRNPLVYNNRGMFQQSQGRFQEAIADFSRAIGINPQYYYSLTNRAAAHLENGDPDAAVKDFTASLRINANQPSVLNMRGSARLAQGDIDGALSDQNQVLKLVPKFAPAHADLGFIQFFSEDYKSAGQSFNQAIELDPQLRHVYAWRYWALTLSGQPDEATQGLAAMEPSEEVERDWIDRLVDYLQGELSEEDLLASVSGSDEKERNVQICEAHFFIGLQKSSDGEQQQAARHFQQSVDTKATTLSAYRGAQFALKRKTAGGVGAAAR